jgi:hypothetical protein
MRRGQHRRRSRHDNIRTNSGDFPRHGATLPGIHGETEFESNIAAVDPAKLLQCGTDCLAAPLDLGIVCGAAEPNENNRRPVLCMCRKR